MNLLQTPVSKETSTDVGKLLIEAFKNLPMILPIRSTQPNDEV